MRVCCRKKGTTTSPVNPNLVSVYDILDETGNIGSNPLYGWSDSYSIGSATLVSGENLGLNDLAIIDSTPQNLKFSVSGDWTVGWARVEIRVGGTLVASADASVFSYNPDLDETYLTGTNTPITQFLNGDGTVKRVEITMVAA